jgi:imidazolonepropionase-like amidohydrolase
MSTPSKVLIMMSIAIALILFFLSLPTPEPGSTDPAGSGETDSGTPGFVIHNVHVFDGEELVRNRRVRVNDGRIQSISADQGPLPGGETIDGEGGYLLPGFIDSHVHIFGNGLSDALEYGVTSVVDLFTRTTLLEPAESNRADIDHAEGADMWSAGTLVTAPGGHGTQFGLNIPTLENPANAEAFVEARIREGSDFIKLVVESGEAHGMEFPTLSADTVEAVVEAAHAHDRLAIAHTGTREEARLAINAGADGLAHAFGDAPLDEALRNRLAEDGRFVVPTLTVIGGPHVQSNVAAMEHAGVPILAGSDAPNAGLMQGRALHRELLNLVEAGLTPLQALKAATSRPAERLGLEQRGRIAPGYRADLLLVRNSPLDDIRHTSEIEAIWKNGHRVEPASGETESRNDVPPASTGSEQLIASFDDGIHSAFGAGWEASSDGMMDGNSSAQLEHREDGHLRVNGEVRSGFSWPFAGVTWWPGQRPMAPVDLSDYDGIGLRIRSESPATLRLMIFDPASRQGTPPQKRIQVDTGWQVIRLPFSNLAEVNPASISGLGLYAGPQTGPFAFELDRVWLTAGSEQENTDRE